MNLISEPMTLDANYEKIPCNLIAISEEGAATFNEILRNLRGTAGLTTITRTKSGGISTTQKTFRPPMYDVRTLKSCVEITFVGREMWRVQFRRPMSKESGDGGISGHASFRKFKEDLKKQGIDIEKWAIYNGKEVKETIPPPIVKCSRETFIDIELSNVHHMDKHSSHMAGVAQFIPQWYPLINHYYKNRKDPKYSAVYKSILTHTWGYLQSKMVGFRFSHISKAGIEYTNREVMELSDRLTAAGRVPLLYNTDGIWYWGDIYHGVGEGADLGQWENDHVNCKFRMKSAGVYEYIEAGEYHAVVRGHTALDKIKPRETWEWGDIYKFSSVTGFGINEDGYIINLKDGRIF